MRVRRVVIVLMVLCSIGLGATVAYAYTVVKYSDGTSRAPGGYHQTSGYAARQYNRACRNAGTGEVSVAYYNTGGTRIQYSGAMATNCSTTEVQLGSSSYAAARCTNQGGVSFVMVCETTKP